MAKYELSGDFALHERSPPSSGNLLTFDCPDGTAPLDNNETVYSALSWSQISDKMSTEPRTNVVQAAELVAYAGIIKLIEWAKKEAVVVELAYAKFEDRLDEIANVKPWSMSWSNVLDYVNLDEFHSMAQRCSQHGDTIHFGYSMNWIMNTMGVNILDVHDAEARLTLIDVSNKNVEIFYKQLGFDNFLRLPPPVNPINTTAHFGLERLYWKK
jgi:hypothetical protein